MRFELTRRLALKWLGMGSVAAFGAEELLAKFAAAAVAPRPKATVVAQALSATFSWSYSNIPSLALLQIATHEDMSSVMASAKLSDDEHSYRLAVAPDTDYFWTLSYPGSGDPPLTGRFRTGKPQLDDTADDAVRYQNPRVGAHWSAGGLGLAQADARTRRPEYSSWLTHIDLAQSAWPHAARSRST
jgi:hypothetical protein